MFVGMYYVYACISVHTEVDVSVGMSVVSTCVSVCM